MPKSTTPMKQYGVRVNGVLVRKSFTSATAARKWQRDQKKVQDDLRSGGKKLFQPTLLAIHAVDFLKSRRDQSSFQHQEIWMGKYILARPTFRDKYLHELTRMNWREIFGDAGELIKTHSLAPATHNRVRSMVRKMYEDARRNYEPPRVLDNPISDIDPLHEPRKKMPVLATQDEMLRYLESAYQDATFGWGIFSMIKLNTGLRQSNLIALRWSDVDLANRVLWVRFKRTRAKGLQRGTKKGQDEQSLGINEALHEALLSHRNRTKFTAPEDWLVTQADGRPFMYWNIQDCHERTIKRAGLDYISEHKLRHTYATHYLRSGGTLHDLKLNLFHSSITVTEKYAQALPQELGRRANQFQVALPGKKATVSTLKIKRK